MKPSQTKAENEIFGDAPEDVIANIGYTADALGWLATLMAVLQEELKREKPSSFRMESLIGLSRYIAEDWGNQADVYQEQYSDRLALYRAGIPAA